MKLNATSEMIPVTWPELGRIHSQLASRHFHDALDDVRGLRPSCSAIRIGCHLVGEYALDFNVDGRNLVATCQHERRQLWNQRSQQLVIRSHVGKDADAQAQHRTVLLKREFDVVDGVATMNRRRNVFASGLRPLHRTAQFHG